MAQHVRGHKARAHSDEKYGSRRIQRLPNSPCQWPAARGKRGVSLTSIGATGSNCVRHVWGVGGLPLWGGVGVVIPYGVGGDSASSKWGGREVCMRVEWWLCVAGHTRARACSCQVGSIARHASRRLGVSFSPETFARARNSSITRKK